MKKQCLVIDVRREKGVQLWVGIKQSVALGWEEPRRWWMQKDGSQMCPRSSLQTDELTDW